MKAIYLFAGGGGGTQGGELAGLEAVGATDIDKLSCSIHRRMLGSDRVIERDISEISVEDAIAWGWKSAHICIAGSPCVDFSSSGKRQGIEGSNGCLALELVRILEGLETPFLIFENVPGFLSLNEGRDFLEFIEALDSAGYSGISTLVRGTHWVAQERTRIYLIAVHKHWINLGTDDDHFLSGMISLPPVLATLIENLPLSHYDPTKTVVAPISELKAPTLKFFTWHNGKGLATDAEFDNFSFSTLSLKDCLQDGVALLLKERSGDRYYSEIAPTLRGMNRASNSYRPPGSGKLKVVKNDYSLRPVLPEEIEALMGWKIGSTELDEKGKTVPATHRIRLLLNGMIPGAIAHQIRFVQQVWQKASVSPLPAWVGNKRWLVPAMEVLFLKKTRFVDPFCGSCVIPFSLGIENALLSDINPWLINFLRCVQNGLRVPEDFYLTDPFIFYAVREVCRKIASNPSGERDAVIFYYLARTSVKQICRFNQKGEFNAPYGGFERPVIPYIDDFSSFGVTAFNWEFQCEEFGSILQKVKTNDFVFLDPPYYSEASGFVGYSGHPFGWTQQSQLVETVKSKSCPIVACNSSHPKIVQAYQDAGFQTYFIPVSRKVNSSGDRTPALEMLAFKNINSDVIDIALSKLPKFTSGENNDSSCQVG